MPPQGRLTQTVAASALASAADFPDDAETQIVLFSGATAEEFEAWRLNPTGSLAADFRETARAFALDVAATRTLVRYSAGRTPAAYEVAYLRADRVAGLADALAESEAPVELALFDPSSPAANSLRFYVVAVRTPSPGWIHFIRAKGATLRLSRTRKIAAVMRGAVYDELEADPLVFDTTFDAIVSNGVALIVNQTRFERALGFVAEAQARARETLETLTQHLEVANEDEFVAAASSDLNMVAKVRGIAERIASDAAYAAAMTTHRLIQFAEDNAIAIDVEETGGQRRLVFHPEPARRWRILKLLDDDYLHSQLTEHDYEVNSKSPR